MPPANSPIQAPTGGLSESNYLDQLALLASPVPNLAATLSTQAEEDANDENVSFLRLPISQPQDDGMDSENRRRGPWIGPLHFEQRRAHVEAESQRWLRRAGVSNRRYTQAQLQELDHLHDTSPVPRTGTTLRYPIGYQGWAPGSSDNETEDPHLTLSDLRALARGHTRSDQENATRRHLREQRDSDTPAGPSRFTTPRDVPWGQSHFVDDASGAEATTTESSLRTTALLQSVRRHARFTPRSRNHLEAYILERERSSQAETRERLAGARAARAAASETLGRLQALDPRSEIRARMLALQRAEHVTSAGSSPDGPIDGSLWLEETIKYLERLRFCDTYSERISSAAAGGFIRGEYFTHNHEDFILDTKVINPPPKSSWLKVGGVFSGSQHATCSSSLPSYHVTAQSRRSPRTLAEVRTANTTRSFPTSVLSSSGDDTWPVKVTINSIDWENMTLSGTMEAINVPHKTHPPQESSITTFLEGEIIDFNKFTLETKSFDANASVDSTYWRKLAPFKGLLDSEIVSNLVSMKWLTEELGKKWILMRWKEKCFVTPSDESELTISGFYYVSMRRDDGRVEGLYYDPNSSPYQHLELMPERRMFPTYEFR